MCCEIKKFRSTSETKCRLSLSEMAVIMIIKKSRKTNKKVGVFSKTFKLQPRRRRREKATLICVVRETERKFMLNDSFMVSSRAHFSKRDDPIILGNFINEDFRNFFCVSLSFLRRDFFGDCVKVDDKMRCSMISTFLILSSLSKIKISKK